MMNELIRLLFLLTNGVYLIFSMNDFCDNKTFPDEYIPLRYSTIKSFVLTNPCNTDKSILIRKNFVYKLDRKELQWKRLCISRRIFSNQIPIVNSIAHLNNDLIIIINGILFRTQNIISSSENVDIIYKLFRYSNIPILSEKIDYVFTTPCCTCHKSNTQHFISHAFNEYIILANKDGNVILFYFKSMTVIFNFGNIFQSQSICKSNQCSILYIGLSHSLPILMCIIKYQMEKALIFHQSFLELNLAFPQSTFINFTGETLHITPSTFHDAYFIWDETRILYTSNGGFILSEVITSGCQLDNMNEYQLKNYYTNLDIDYDNIALLTKEMYCFNKTIDYIFVSNNEFFLMTKNNEWLYGKESFIPSIWYLSMINLEQHNQCGPIVNIPNSLGFVQGTKKLDEYFNKSYCLLNINQQLLPCSSFVQSVCSYIRFEPLFDVKQLYLLEKNSKKYFQFILESYTIIPIMIISTKSNLFHYSVNYTINRLNNGIVQIKGNILVSTTNQTSDNLHGSSLLSLRLGLIQYGYSCSQAPSFSFQIEASCSSYSAFRIERNVEFDFWNETNPIIDIEWIQQNIPENVIHQFSSVYIKLKQIDSISLKYQYCFNQTCRLIAGDQLDSLIIYAIPINTEHENYAHYLINRTDTCVHITRTIYRLWLKWTLNMTTRTQLVQIPYERRTFYQTLLNILSIPNNSCLFFNASNSISINQSINQVSHKNLKFLLHIIAYKTKFSFCDLETFILIEIEPIYHIHNPYRGFIFLIILFIFILFFILFISIYTYYKHQQNKKYLEYRRLNQLNAGQFHQWYDIARFLNQNKNTDNYKLIQNYLRNIQLKTNLTEYHT